MSEVTFSKCQITQLITIVPEEYNFMASSFTFKKQFSIKVFFTCRNTIGAKLLPNHFSIMQTFAIAIRRNKIARSVNHGYALHF